MNSNNPANDPNTQQNHPMDNQGKLDGNVIYPMENNDDMEKISPTQTFSPHKSQVYTIIVFLDFIIPISLIFITLGTMSIAGLLTTIFLIILIAVTNKSKNNFKYIQVLLLIIFVLLFVLFLFTIFNATDTYTINENIRILGMDFSNSFVSNSYLAMSFCIVQFLSTFITLGLMATTPFQEFYEIRTKFVTSLIYEYVTDLLWNLTLTYVGASTSSYLFLPLLLYFTYTSVMSSITGHNTVPIKLQNFIGFYSFLHTLFLQYTMSYIGSKWEFASYLKFSKISPDKVDGFLMFVNILSSYISMQLMTGPNASQLRNKVIPSAIVKLGKFFTLLAFSAIFLFSIPYPSYIALVWLLFTFIASFLPYRIVSASMFKIMSVLYIVTFLAMMITCFDLLSSLQPSNSLIIDIGFFKYKGNFAFTCEGFFIATILGQIGRIIHINNTDNEEELYFDESDPEEWRTDEEFEEDSDSDKELSSSDEKAKAKQNKKKLTIEEKRKMRDRARRKRIFKEQFVQYLTIILICGSIMVGITYGFYQDRYAYQILFCIYMLITFFSLFYHGVYQFLKFITGLFLLVALFFYVNQSSYSWLEKAGLQPTLSENPIDYLWPIMIDFFFTIFLTSSREALKFSLPNLLSTCLFLIIVILEYIFIFIYDTNIFNLAFSFVAIGMLSCIFLNLRRLMVFASVLTSIICTILLVFHQLTLFDSLRNLLASVISPKIFNFGEIAEPSGQIALVSLILFCSTIALKSNKPTKPDWLTDQIANEILRILRSFFFYLSWIFTLGFSMANEYPTFIKFIFSLAFLMGKLSSSLFIYIRYPTLIFQLFLLAAEYCFQIFDFTIYFYTPSTKSRFIDIVEYVGLVFAPGTVTKSQRNISYAWQLSSLLITVINLRPLPSEPDKKFIQMVGMRIWDAFCAMLHHWLPVFVDLILCISTLSNPSVFGFLSFFILILVSVKGDTLTKTVTLLLIFIFNIALIIQYLFWLGLPVFIDHWEVSSLVNKWGSFLGVVDVKTDAILSNAIACLVLTLYSEFHFSFIDYDMRYDNLPQPMKAIIDFVVRYVFEISMVTVLIVNSQITSIDGILFFILTAILFITAVTSEYPPQKVINLLSTGTFIVVGLRLLSRIPVFTSKGIGATAQKLFDLPFDGKSQFESRWILIYFSLRLGFHINKSKIKAEVRLREEQHLAFKYIRYRQLEILEALDSKILALKYEILVSEIKQMTAKEVYSMKTGENPENQVLTNPAPQMNPSSRTSRIHQSINLQRGILSQANLIEQKPRARQTLDLNRIPSMNALPPVDKDNDDSDNIEDEDDDAIIVDQKKIERKEGNWFLRVIFYPLVDAYINIIASSFSLNSEAGINVLTLETVAIILRKQQKGFEGGRPAEMDYKERHFIKMLPPSFMLQMHSLGSLINFNFDYTGKRAELFWRYTLLLIRRSAFPLLVLMIIIFSFLKPYLFAMVFLIYVVGYIASMENKKQPFIYRVLLVLSIILLLFRKLANVVYLDEILDKAVNSVSEKQRSISILDLFGLTPSGGATIEVLLFMCVVYFVSDSKEMLHIQTKQELTKHFMDNEILKKHKLTFPDHFCYEVIGNPMKLLGFNDDFDQKESIISLYKSHLHRSGLLLTSHQIWLIVIDMLCLVYLFVALPYWTTSNEAVSSAISTSSLNTVSIFLLIIHVSFALVAYYAVASQQYVILFFQNIINLLYEIIIIFFYLLSIMGHFTASLGIYTAIRILWHLIAAHKVKTCKVFTDFILPDFANKNEQIFWANKFIRYFPFVFEIRILISWLSRPTNVSLSDFFVIQDFKHEIECIMAVRVREKKEKLTIKAIQADPNIKYDQEKVNDSIRQVDTQKRCIIGCPLLLLLFLLIFVPLMFMTNVEEDRSINPLDEATLEIGFANTPPLVTIYGDISNITHDYSKELYNNSDSRISTLGKLNYKDMSLVKFSRLPGGQSEMTHNGVNQLLRQVESGIPISLYYKLKLNFRKICGPAKSKDVLYFNSILLDKDNLERLSNILDESVTFFEPIQSGNLTLPKVFLVMPDAPIKPYTHLANNFTLTKMPDLLIWDLAYNESNTNVSFLKSTYWYSLLVYAVPTTPGSNLALSSTGIVGLYILIILTFGEVMRSFSETMLTNLWVDKIKKPKKLYRLLAALDAYRMANQKAKEKELSSILLETLKSQESIIKMTS